MAKADTAVNKTAATEQTVNESVNMETTVEAVEETAVGGLSVTRESYLAKKTKKKYYAYFVKGEVRGHKLKAEVAPPKMYVGTERMLDSGGFEMLDMLFDTAVPADAVFVDREMVKTSQDGIKKENAVYTVWSADQNGEVLRVVVTPIRPSDGTKLEALFSSIS